MNIVRPVINDQIGDRGGLGHQGEQRFIPPEALFHPTLLGHVAAAPHSTDYPSIVVPERGLDDIEEEKLPPDVPVLVEPLRLSALHDDRIGVPADLSEGVPGRVVRAGSPFTIGKEHICPAQRFVGIGSVEEFLADGPVRKEVSPLRIFCPYEIGDVVAHHPDQTVEVAEPLVGPGEFALHALSLRYIAEHDEVCVPPFKGDLRAERFDPSLVPVEILHRVVDEAAAMPGTQVREVPDDGLLVVGVGELQRVLADELGRRRDAGERCDRGIGKQDVAVPVEDDDGVYEGVKDLQVLLPSWKLPCTGVSGGDDAGDIRIREGGCGNRHGQERTVTADQIGGKVCNGIPPADRPDEPLPLCLVWPYIGESEGCEFLRRVTEHAGDIIGGPGDAKRSRAEGEDANLYVSPSVFGRPGFLFHCL
ncbi:hypothetical protein DSECCO2_618110 [anaerobic digester metagenome]